MGLELAVWSLWLRYSRCISAGNYHEPQLVMASSSSSEARLGPPDPLFLLSQATYAPRCTPPPGFKLMPAAPVRPAVKPMAAPQEVGEDGWTKRPLRTEAAVCSEVAVVHPQAAVPAVVAAGFVMASPHKDSFQQGPTPTTLSAVVGPTPLFRHRHQQFANFEGNIGALISRIVFWGPLYYKYNEEPPK